VFDRGSSFGVCGWLYVFNEIDPHSAKVMAYLAPNVPDPSLNFYPIQKAFMTMRMPRLVRRMFILGALFFVVGVVAWGLTKGWNRAIWFSAGGLLSLINLWVAVRLVGRGLNF
jgi:hypothetical protein